MRIPHLGPEDVGGVDSPPRGLLRSDGKMRILQINKSDSGGGAEGSAWNLFRAYRDRGHDSWLAVGYRITADPGVVEIPNYSRRHRWARWLYRFPRYLQARRFRGAGTAGEIFMPFAEPGRFLQRIRGLEDFCYPGTADILSLLPHKPHLIHCHNLHGGFFDLRVLPALSRQVPVILNLRDTWLLTGHCAHNFDCQRWKIGCGSCPYLNIYPALWRDGTHFNWERKREIYAGSKLYVTAPSKWLIDMAQESILRGLEYRVIPNAIDLTVFQPYSKERARSELGLPLESKIVLFAAHRARTNPFKDFKTIEAALSVIGAQSSRHDTILMCLGDSGSERQIGSARVVFAGWISEPRRIARYYQAADVYIHAAKAEAFGKTIAEALACGIPVVATAVGGIPELIEDGVTGFLVPPADAPALAAGVIRVLNQDDLHRSMSSRATESASRRFDLNRQVESFLRWYEELIELPVSGSRLEI